MRPVPGQCCPPGRVLSQHASGKQTDDHTEVPPHPLPGSARLEVSRTPQPARAMGVGCLVPFTSAGPACWTAVHQGPGPTGFLPPSLAFSASRVPALEGQVDALLTLGAPVHLHNPLFPSAPGDGTIVCLHVPSRSSTPRWAPERASQGGGCKWHSTAFPKEAGLGLGAECWPSTQCVHAKTQQARLPRDQAWAQGLQLQS